MNLAASTLASPRPALRRVLVPLAVAFAILVPIVQASADLGLSAGEFARDGQQTLRAAGYAFSIWSLIYAGLIAYALWQALPRNADRPGLDRIAAPAIAAIAGCGLWIIASSADWKWASVAIIVTSAGALVAGLLATRADRAEADGRDRWLVWAPLGLLAGWLTIASAINILTVLTAEGMLDGVQQAAAFVGIAVVVGVAAWVMRAARLWVYGVPIAWGLVAVWVAERAEKPEVAVAALAGAVGVGVFAGWVVWLGRRGGLRG